MNLKVVLGNWNERLVRELRVPHTECACDWIKIRTIPGVYPVTLKWENPDSHRPIPAEKASVRIPAIITAGQVHSTFGGQIFHTLNIFNGTYTYRESLHLYEIHSLAKDGTIELLPQWGFFGRPDFRQVTNQMSREKLFVLYAGARAN